MDASIQLILNPEEALEPVFLKQKLAEKLGITANLIVSYRIIKRSIDARGSSPKVNLTLEYALIGKELRGFYSKKFNYQNVKDRDSVIIVGSGPAGIFAALKLIELGLKPIIFERGKKLSRSNIKIIRYNK